MPGIEGVEILPTPGEAAEIPVLKQALIHACL